MWTPIPQSPELPRPAGAYSPGVRAGDFVFVSGQVPRDPATGEIDGTDTATQTRRVLDNLRRVLAAAEASMSDVVSVMVHLADASDWGEFNAVYQEFFQAPFPSRTVVGAQLRGIRVEVSAVAYAPRGGRERADCARHPAPDGGALPRPRRARTYISASCPTSPAATSRAPARSPRAARATFPPS